MNLHSFCIVFVLHYLCTHEEDTFSTRILRHGQLSDGEGIERGIRGGGGSADSRLAIASQEGAEWNQDTLAHFSPLFLEHYNQAFHFPGGHTPTEQEVKTWYAPLAQKMLMEFSVNF